MPKEPAAHQHALEMVTLESLVPEDHLLRQIDAVIDFEFIRDKVRHLYCIDNRRPATDPVVSFKLLFISYLIESDEYECFIDRVTENPWTTV